jgi:molecular chaperone DnaJ
MSVKRDYYEVLGIERTADGDTIKRAYRRLALKYHPDNYKGDKTEGETKFKELAEAYEVLRDPEKRQRYDRFGHEGLRGAGVHDFSSMGFGDIFSMFQDIFGGGFGGGRPRQQRGLDLETEVTLSLEEVATGVDQTLEFQRQDFCEACSGSGAKPGSQPDKCVTCGGYGQVQQQMSGFFGMSVRVVACPDCQGQGTVVKDKCAQCGGTGRQKKKRLLTVHVPPGVREGQVIRIRGEGEPARVGMAKGDLHVYVTIKPHPLLVRQGNDLVCQVPVSFAKAALGGKVEVPTLAGPEDVDLPAGTQSGEVITLRKRGLPAINSGRNGDQHVQVLVEVPRKLSKKQRELLEAYAETEQDGDMPKRKSFLDQLKSYFTD